MACDSALTKCQLVLPGSGVRLGLLDEAVDDSGRVSLP